MPFGIFLPTLRRKRSGGTLPLISKIRCGSNYGNIALGVDGTLWAWGGPGSQLGLGAGSSNPSITPKQIGTDEDWVDIATTGQVSWAIKSNGTLWGWGSGSSSLGIGASVNTALYTPTQIGTDTNWMKLPLDAVTGGAAIKTDNSLYCWGNNTYGQLFGVGNVTASIASPVKVTTGSTTWAEVAIGTTHSLAITPSGNIYSCGNNAHGQCGHSAGFGGSSTAAQAVTYIGNSPTIQKSLCVGYVTSFLRNNSGVQSQSFGSGNSGILGTGSISNTYTKGNITSGLNYTRIIAKQYTAHALDSSGKLYRWGYGSATYFGGGTATVPVETGENDASIVDIAMGLSWLMVLKSDGSLWSRGANNAGQLGYTGGSVTTLARIN